MRNTSTPNLSGSTRLVSLDVLRGLDMLWIIGGGAVIGYLAQATGLKWIDSLAAQMEHVKWEGFHFEDLIFPLFMFISGVAIPYSVTGKLEKGVSVKNLFGKISKRMIMLVLLGIIWNGALAIGFSHLRYASVLGQIGIAYFFAALIILHTSRAGTRIYWLIGILCLIAFLQLAIPVPGFGPGVMTPEGSINSWIDQHFLPGVLYGGNFDPEGILCVISATGVTLAGSLAGSVIRNNSQRMNYAAFLLAVTGVLLTISSLLLSIFYPVIKAMWTVSFDLLTSGISFMLLALFYFIIDVKKWRSWIFFFQVIGLNSITIYLCVNIFDFYHLSDFFLGWISHLTGSFGPVILSLGEVIIEWLFLYFLYKRNIFLRI